MNTGAFNKIVKQALVQCEQVLGVKAEEYAHGDRLSNFKRAAEMLRCTPEKALVGMLAKHLISVIDIVDDIEVGKAVNLEMVREKTGDAMNYMILLRALIEERVEEEINR